MKATPALLCILALAGGFALGRFVSRGQGPERTASVASFREALAARDELVRVREISTFLERLGPEDLPAALEALEARQLGVTREEVRLFMLAWSRFDAPGAFAWARARTTEWTDTLMTEAIYAWGLRDARAALRELEAMDDPALRIRLETSLVEGWLRGDDRAGASEYIAAISNPQQRRRLTLKLAREALREGPEAVMRWVDAVPEDAPNDFKRGAFYHGSAVVARADARQAAAWFETHRTRPYSAGALEPIARRWVEYHDPPALFEWLRSLPSEGAGAGERRDALAAAFRVWMRKEPEKAEAWLASALPEPAFDAAVAEVVRAHVRVSPAAAMEWTVRIQDEARRREMTLMAGRRWQQRDPEAARAWLAKSDLPEDLVQAILGVSPASIGPQTPPQPPAPAPPR